jgi:ferric-dicitrate binding protein FerR (iron transport regulator)
MGEFSFCSRGTAPDAPQQRISAGEPLWLSGILSFTHADLRFVCDEISRQLNARIVLNKPGLDTLKVTGLIKGRDINEVLSAIAGLTGTSVRKEKDGYVVF